MEVTWPPARDVRLSQSLEGTGECFLDSGEAGGDRGVSLGLGRDGPSGGYVCP